MRRFVLRHIMYASVVPVLSRHVSDNSRLKRVSAACRAVAVAEYTKQEEMDEGMNHGCLARCKAVGSVPMSLSCGWKRRCDDE